MDVEEDERDVKMEVVKENVENDGVEYNVYRVMEGIVKVREK